MLPKEAIQEFIELYFAAFGVRLEWNVAVDKANRLYRMVKAVIS